MVGAAGQDLQTEVAAHKSWHFFGSFVLCLGTVAPAGASTAVLTGANETASDEKQTAFTTFEQALLFGAVTVRQRTQSTGTSPGETGSSSSNSVGRSTSTTLPRGLHHLADVDWIHHERFGPEGNGNGTAYIPLVPASRTMTLENRDRTGNWLDIGVNDRNQTVGVFDVYQNHSDAATAEYGYLVLPGVTALAADAFADAGPAVETHLGPHVNAALSGTVMSAVFFQAKTDGRAGVSDCIGGGGSVRFGDGTDRFAVQVDQPAIVLVDYLAANASSVRVHVSTPVPKEGCGGPRVLIGGHFPNGSGCSIHNATFTAVAFLRPPTGDRVGETQTAICSK